MTYSCAIFKVRQELVKGQEVLEIGCGWGTLAIEIVRQTGCKYTGITLSELQLKYAEIKVKEAGLQDTSDYIFVITVNCLKPTNMTELFLEAVGHDYMEELFSCCESLLAENGLSCSTVANGELLVDPFEFISVPDQCYDEHSLGPGFIKEYIFPSGCLPSLRRVTSAMTSSSRLCFWLLRTSPSTGAESPAGSRVDFPNTVGSSNPNTSPHTKFISKPNKCYNEYKLNLDFRKEYIFLGGYIPSLSV
ncbi:hypothetical protein KPL71_027103 [Citrus sinensis]|uniref:Uncharacterized protein n=1 Tax=Citrus sinensis TaxID=2711 RepID=A0ACB8I3W7_CITSI|nr:hypothetical protein KPL71_027103 [Citrus sinensis]